MRKKTEAETKNTKEKKQAVPYVPFRKPFKNNHDVFFGYCAIMSNPNGDPANENHPRQDDVTERLEVSDVRIKRTVRDEIISLAAELAKTIYVDNTVRTVDMRYKALESDLMQMQDVVFEANLSLFEDAQAELGLPFDKKALMERLASPEIGGDPVNRAKAILGECWDVRCFGAVFPVKNRNFSWAGPVQVLWSHSMHAAVVEYMSGTGAFASQDATKKTFSGRYLTPFALIGVPVAISNNHLRSGLIEQEPPTDEDIEFFLRGLYNGTNNLRTTSKNQHSCFLLDIVYKEGERYSHSAKLPEEVKLLNPGTGARLTRVEELSLRSLEDIEIDFSNVSRFVESNRDKIESAKIYVIPGLKVRGCESLETVVVPAAF